MRAFSEIGVFVLVLLAPVGSNPCQPTVTVTRTAWHRNQFPTSKAVSVTRASHAKSSVAVEKPKDDMTIAITNEYGTHVTLSFGSNAAGPVPSGNPLAAVLAGHSRTQYTFPTGWAGRIGVGPNLNPRGSKIEGSFTGPPDIDVSYVDGYSMPITCSSEGTPVSGCNIDLFRQTGIMCTHQVDGPVCLNSAQGVADGPAPAFFAACAGAAYTYPNDNDANRSNLGSNLISCCVGTSCRAPSRQTQRQRDQTHG